MRTLLIAFLMTLATQAGAENGYLSKDEANFFRKQIDLHDNCIKALTIRKRSISTYGISNLYLYRDEKGTPWERIYSTHGSKELFNPPFDFVPRLSKCNQILPLNLVIECEFSSGLTPEHRLILALREDWIHKQLYMPHVEEKQKSTELHLAETDAIAFFYETEELRRQNIPSLRSLITTRYTDLEREIWGSFSPIRDSGARYANYIYVDRYTGGLKWTIQKYDGVEIKQQVQLIGECNKLSSFGDENYDEVKKFVDEAMKSLANTVVDHYRGLPKFEPAEKKKKF